MSLQTRLAALITAIGADIKAIQTDSRWTNARTPTGAAGGDLGSSYPNPTVVKSAGNFTVNGTLYPNGDIQTDGAVAVDLATQAWESSLNLSSPRLLLPNGMGSLKTRFVRNVNRDVNHRRLSVCWLNSDTVNWQYGTGLEIITRTDYYTAGGLTRCLIGGGYSVAPFIRVIESHGKYPFVPKLGTIYSVNLVPNPSFETDLSGWTNGNTPYETAIRQTSWSTHGSASVRLTKSVAYTAAQQSDFTTPYMSLTSLGLAVGDTVGIGAEVNVYSATGTPYVQARVGFYDASNAYLGSAVASVAPGGLAVTLGTRRVTGSAVIPANCTQIAVSLLAGAGSGTIDIAYDSIIVAKGGVPATFLNTTVKEVEIYYDLQQYMGITAEIRYGGYTEVSRPFTSTSQIAWTGIETILGSAPAWYTGRVDITNGLEFGPGDDSASDVNFYRTNPGELTVGGNLVVSTDLTLNGKINGAVSADAGNGLAAGSDGKLFASSGAGATEVYVSPSAPSPRGSNTLWIDTDDSGIVSPTGIPRVTSLPSNPYDGQEVYYVADNTNGVIWHLRYNAASGYASKWEYVGGASLHSEAASQNTCISGTYVALTNNPTISLPLTGDYDIDIGFRYIQSGALGTIAMSYDIGVTAAVDADAATVVPSTVGEQGRASVVRRKTGLSAVTLTAKYRAGNADFLQRYIRVIPVRVGP